MLKRYLLAPGPTQVPPEVLLAMARPMLHPRCITLLGRFRVESRANGEASSVMASAAVEAWCGFGEVRASVDAIGSGGLSAVDDKRVPDGEGGAVGAEPEDRVGDLVGGA